MLTMLRATGRDLAPAGRVTKMPAASASSVPARLDIATIARYEAGSESRLAQ